ncbi:MAG: DeoR/GlpR family DNA-binding transcription regulator [Clostridiales bacterium]|nr:DeoR/GlpR family DNA-binding transcription regulator [Clostridiales bacterium]
MILNDRQTEILEFLKKNRRASVRKLAESFFVSEMTVRRDLKEMEKMGYIQRYSGGALIRDGDLLPVEERKLLHNKEKDMLSKRAKKYLRDNMTVFIDSSSTCTYVIPILAEYKGITIVTNSVLCLLTAAKYHIPCMAAGGRFVERDMCTVGSATEKFLSDVNPDLSFFSAQGISDDGVISDSDEAQSAVRRVVIKNSAQNLFLFDGSKQHKKFPFTICRAEDASDIIVI